MPLTIEDILNRVGVPLDALLDELAEFEFDHPDSAPAIEIARQKLAEKFTPEAIKAKAQADIAELIKAIQDGHGEIDRDNITDIQ